MNAALSQTARADMRDIEPIPPCIRRRGIRVWCVDGYAIDDVPAARPLALGRIDDRFYYMDASRIRIFEIHKRHHTPRALKLLAQADFWNRCYPMRGPSEKVH